MTHEAFALPPAPYRYPLIGMGPDAGTAGSVKLRATEYKTYADMYLKAAESISNSLNQVILSEPVCASLQEKLETNLDHGYFHLRRVEKWLKQIYGKDVEFSMHPSVVTMSLASFISIRTHDLVELETGDKIGHDAAGALFVLGAYSGMFDAMQAIAKEQGLEPMDKSQWNSIVWGSAFINLHHSKPEKAPSVQSILTHGLLDPQTILAEVEQAAQKKGMTLEEYFPPYAIMSDAIAKIRAGEMHAPVLSMHEANAIHKQLVYMAGCDKLDGLYPADLSATRTILTRPNRVFWAPTPRFTGIPDTSELTLSEEFEFRRKDGGGHESACDLNRLIFEISRVSMVNDASPYFKWLYRIGLQDKSKLVLELNRNFLHGDFSLYHEIYRQFELDTMIAMLDKAGVEQTVIQTVSAIQDDTVRSGELRRILKKQSVDPDLVDFLSSWVRSERDMVINAVEHKYEGLVEQNLSESEKERVMLLLQMAVYEQNRVILAYPGPMEKPVMPYPSYYLIDLKDWQLDQKGNPLT